MRRVSLSTLESKTINLNESIFKNYAGSFYYFFWLFISNLWKKNLEDIALTELGH